LPGVSLSLGDGFSVAGHGKQICPQALPFVLAGSSEELLIATESLETLRFIKRSVNVVAVKIREAVGPATVVEYAHKMGITTALTPTLALALGASEVTLINIAKTYATFPNLGSWSGPATSS
jgi:hypothetical protein